MRGGGRGGGGRQPYAAPVGADVAAIPPASRPMVQSLKGILADRSEAEIYATLCDCGMDPDIAVDRLISQGMLESALAFRPPHGSNCLARTSWRDTHSTGGAKGPTKKEAELHASLNSSTLDSVKTTETISAAGSVAKNEIPVDVQADAKYNSNQPPPQVQHCWGVLGRPSMADVVKMGRPQAKVASRSVAGTIGMPAIVDSVTSNAPSRSPKESNRNVAATKLPNGTSVIKQCDDASLVDVTPTSEVPGVEESIGSLSANTNLKSSSAPDGVEKEEDAEEAKKVSDITEIITSSGQFSASGEEVETQQTATASQLDNGSVMKTDDFQYNEHSFEHNQPSNGDMPTTMEQFEHLTLHEENEPKPSDDKPAVIIPGHLQVSDADCAHLTFGSFVSGTLDAPLSVKPLNNDEEVATVSDNQTIDHPDASNMESLNDASVQQSEVPRTDFIDVTNNAEYNLSLTPNYSAPSVMQPDSASHNYLQESRQLQNISPLATYMQGNIPNGLLPPAIPPLREFDPAFSLLLTNPPLAAMVHGTTSSSMSNTAVSTQPQENNPGGLSNAQLSQAQPSTSIASGPPLPQHLPLHPYAQATLPLGYASMIGYPSLPQSYAYIPPGAFQQPYLNSGLFHQAAAPVPNSNMKYPLPQYKSNIALAGLPQLSNYAGAFGTANNMPGNFNLNQSTASASAPLGFDGSVPSQYKDGNQYISLQQGENPAMWMHGAGSRAMPPLAANTLYGYQGQSHQAGLRQGQLPSQFGAALGQSQAGLGPEHRNPSDSNLSAAAQPNPMWPNGY
ncbi:hypothetical protein PR202_gb02230 [Eleusine coracana subsp. coracana]|uniref:GBF-interacting protein 1 N-terminal domain-containing protein n=1 Tax=Eleusine coracana subsp. coracana TaxID=191504 RepID=A0AAV5DW76_ELECO|nr:hypothetical protein PR202_gb02230 [Eleusine coracana subsp. coracana]